MFHAGNKRTENPFTTHKLCTTAGSWLLQAAFSLEINPLHCLIKLKINWRAKWILQHLSEVFISEAAFTAETFYEQNFCPDTAFLVANTSVILHTLLSIDVCGIIGLHLFLRHVTNMFWHVNKICFNGTREKLKRRKELLYCFLFWLFYHLLGVDCIHRKWRKQIWE